MKGRVIFKVGGCEDPFQILYIEGLNMGILLDIKIIVPFQDIIAYGTLIAECRDQDEDQNQTQENRFPIHSPFVMVSKCLASQSCLFPVSWMSILMEPERLGNTAGISGNLGIICTYRHGLPQGNAWTSRIKTIKMRIKTKKAQGISLRLFIREEYQVTAIV